MVAENYCKSIQYSTQPDVLSRGEQLLIPRSLELKDRFSPVSQIFVDSETEFGA